MAKQTAKPKIRKKKWYKIVSPRVFREQVIGESHLFDPEEMKGRTFSINMMNLTGHPKHQSINIMLRVADVKDNKGLTEMVGFQMQPSILKRIVRRRRTKVDDSIVLLTKDKKKVRIKPLLITNTQVDKSGANSIRIMVRNKLSEFVRKITYDKLADEIVSFKLQKIIGNAAAEVAPIKSYEVRGFKLIEKEGVPLTKPSKPKIPSRKKTTPEIRTPPEQKLEETDTKAKPDEKPAKEEPAAKEKPKPEAKQEEKKEADDKKSETEGKKEKPAEKEKNTDKAGKEK